jgi:hypothetical protein
MIFPLFFRLFFVFFFSFFSSVMSKENSLSHCCIQETDYRKYINFTKMAKILRFPKILEVKIIFENKLNRKLTLK